MKPFYIEKISLLSRGYSKIHTILNSKLVEKNFKTNFDSSEVKSEIKYTS